MRLCALSLSVAGLLLFPSMLSAQTGSPAAASAQASGPSVEDRVTNAESRLAKLEKLEITGYVQTRLVYQNDATPLTNLLVKRARLNVRHTGDRSRLAISFDGGQGSVSIMDAYFDVTLIQNRGQRQGAILRAGQFMRPFGFEIERGEAEREFPERPAGWTVFFPGNRDQGSDLSMGLAPTTIANIAVVNGNGTATSVFKDTDDHKDVMVRLRQTLFQPRIDLALSGYLGRQTTAATAAQSAQTGFVDENGNGVQDTGEPTVVVSPAKAAKAAIEGDRNRWGIALNAYDLVGGTLRGEYVGGKNLTTNLGSGPSQAVATAYAWYVQYLRYMGAGFTLGVRFDQFDPDIDDDVRLRNDGAQRTFGFLALRWIGDSVRLSLAWERPRVTTYNKTSKTVLHTDDPVWTVQGLYRF